MPDFQAQVFQNEYLPEGGTDVHAIVSVTCANAGAAGQTSQGAAAEIIIIDSSGSMSSPADKIRSARQAASVALDHVLDGTYFALIAGTHLATVVYPHTAPTALTMAVMNPDTRAQAQTAISRLQATGGTAIGSWLALAAQLFGSVSAVQRHAILLTDGQDGNADAPVLDHALQNLRGAFQCDCRGVGADWEVQELRRIAEALLGSVDLISDPKLMADDFSEIMRNAMGRGVSNAELRLWSPQGAKVLSVRQVSPTIDDLTGRAAVVSELVREYATGAWGDETREYHIVVRVPAKVVGSEQLVGRAQLVVAGQVATQGLIKAVWSQDEALSTRINPSVAHFTGQVELAAVIQEGLAAKASGDTETATIKLGRAAQLAAATGNEDATSKLRRVIDIDNAETGTVRLKREVNKIDEMALDTASTKTTRVRP